MVATDTQLLWNSRQAAQALAMSERTLWRRTQDGDIPSVRIGGLVRYSPDSLAEWIKGQETGGIDNGE